MRYSMKAGVLYLQEQAAAKIKGGAGAEKSILSPAGTLLLRAGVRCLEAPPERQGDVRFRQYALMDADGNDVAVAQPDYAQGDDPALTGWPVCRMPRVDHAQILMAGKTYRLNRVNSQTYLMAEEGGNVLLRIAHKGLIGGWNIETRHSLDAALICGLFVFCRYMEQENEFLIV